MKTLVTGLIAVGLTAVPVGHAPAVAAPIAKQEKADKPCAAAKPKKKNGFGRFLGQVASSVAASGAQRMGVPISWGMANTLNAVLTDALSCKLQPEERTRAATATTEVVGKPVGTTSAWTSETRPAVSGSSTVFAQTRLGDGSVCKDVRDIATINGEETTVSKRMCKAPGASGYVMRPGAV